jgi:hypothetical protein
VEALDAPARIVDRLFQIVAQSGLRRGELRR